MGKRRPILSGWYVSQAELQRNGYEDTTIYYFSTERNEWSIFGTDEVVPIRELPAPASEMMRLQLVKK